MTVEAWLLFCATETVLCLSPGPSVLLVISLSLARGRQAGFRATLGVLALTSIAIEFAVLCGYARLAATAARAAGRADSERLLRRAGGLLLIGAGARLAVTREP